MDTDLALVVLVLSMTWLAFWQKQFVLYIISAVITIVAGASWMADLPGISVMLWGLAVYELYMVIVMVFEAGGTARGWSQFKEFWSKSKGGGE